MLETVDDRKKVADKSAIGRFLTVICKLRYSSPIAEHEDIVRLTGLWLPENETHAEIEAGLVNKQAGDLVILDYNPEESNHLFIDREERQSQISIDKKLLETRLNKFRIDRARTGRFYPLSLFLPGSSPPVNAMFPVQVVQIDEQMTANINHPLKGKKISLEMHVEAVSTPVENADEKASDVIKLLSHNGPGMQMRQADTATDFSVEDGFHRQDESLDNGFYSQPRLLSHVDATASSNIADLYTQLIKPGDHVLDLMSSYQSHLPTNKTYVTTGLGMNEIELQSNHQLNEYLVHDLNHDTQIPCAKNTFDAVICNLSIEYLIKPLDIFKEVKRVLKPNGYFIITFSNRWFPSKAIKLWTQLHDFEKMGWLLELFVKAGGFSSLQTKSIRGYPRPVDEMYTQQLKHADPVFAVWGKKNTR